MAYKTPNKTSEYIRSLMAEEPDSILSSIILEADKSNIPILLPEAAAFTKQLILMNRPSNILEVGTAIGYSGYIFLKNCDGRLTTLDKNGDYLAKACNYFDRAGFAGRYHTIEGDAGDIIPKLKDTYDFIFLDGPKAQYIKYLPHLKKLLRKGGILLADNVLFNGMVSGEVESDIKKKNIVSNLRLFLKEIYEDTSFDTSVLNVGDGMSLCIKN